MKHATLDEVKMEVLTWLDRVQKKQDSWYSVNMIRTGVTRNAGTVKLAIQQLIFDGFLHVKHEPSSPNQIYYRLRRDGDQN